MSLSPQFLDELRARTPMSGLVGRSLRLQKAGNEWKACCPFHNEKSASFYVNDDKGFAHCFGCSWNGDAIKWLTDHDGLEFLDAVRQLADAAGMEMPARDPGQRQRDERSAGYHAITGRAEAWFSTQLGGLAGSDARAYLDRRGIKPATARAFGLGFAPDSRNGLRRALAEDGDRALVEVGLLAMREEGGDPYDRFRGRLIFPIHDAKGRAISFGGRILGAGEPKYLNGPETPLFDKGRTLFNLHRAGPAARKAGRIIAVEGYMDVIAIAQAGIEEAVAPLGTALTEAQIERMWRIVQTPILCFDGDAAGQRASAKAALRALPLLKPGQSLAFAMLPAGQDPDDIVREGGREGLERALGAALPMVELLWRTEHGPEPLKTPEARAALKARLIELARSIGDRDVAQAYEQDFRQRIDQLYDRARKALRGKGADAPPVVTQHDPSGVQRKMITAIIKGMARHPKIAAELIEPLAMIRTTDPAHKAAIDRLVDGTMCDKPPTVEEIDGLFPNDRGWQGFAFSFHNPETRPALAEYDLRHMLDMMLAQLEGASPEVLAKMRESYRPPEAPAPGKLV